MDRAAAEKMKNISRDTNIAAEKVLIRLLREAPVYRRLEIASSLVKTTRRLSWQGLCKRLPGETPRTLAEQFLLLLYPSLPDADKIVKCLR